MRSPVLPHKTLLPLLAMMLWALVPGRALAQAQAGAPATPPATGAQAPATATPPSDAPVEEELPAGQEQGERVVEIRVEGNHRVEAEAIRRALVTKQGSLFDPTRSAEDLRAVWNLGYFTDVQLLVQHLPKGVAYVVRVQERPSVRVGEAGGQRGAEPRRPEGADRRQARHHPGHGGRALHGEEDPGQVRGEGLLPGGGLLQARARRQRRQRRRGVRHQRARQGDGEGDQLHRRAAGEARGAQGRDGHQGGRLLLLPHRRGHLPRGGLPARPGRHPGHLLRPRLHQRPHRQAGDLPVGGQALHLRHHQGDRGRAVRHRQAGLRGRPASFPRSAWRRR